MPATVAGLTAIDLKATEIADVLLGHLRAGIDLFDLPDLRTRPSIRAGDVAGDGSPG